MDKSELMRLADKILSESKTAVLATVTADGQPRNAMDVPNFSQEFSKSNLCCYFQFF